MDVLFPGLATIRDLHPLLVHFPIALWSTALLFCTLSFRGSSSLWQAGMWLLYLGSLTALAAAGTGLWAADRLGHDSPGHDLVHLHRNFMIASTAIGVMTSLLSFWMRQRSDSRPRIVTLVGLLLTAALCALGADRGALLVYEHGLGTRVVTTENPGAVPDDKDTQDHDAQDHGAHAH